MRLLPSGEVDDDEGLDCDYDDYDNEDDWVDLDVYGDEERGGSCDWGDNCYYSNYYIWGGEWVNIEFVGGGDDRIIVSVSVIVCINGWTDVYVDYETVGCCTFWGYIIYYICNYSFMI